MLRRAALASVASEPGRRLEVGVRRRSRRARRRGFRRARSRVDAPEHHGRVAPQALRAAGAARRRRATAAAAGDVAQNAASGRSRISRVERRVVGARRACGTARAARRSAPRRASSRASSSVGVLAARAEDPAARRDPRAAPRECARAEPPPTTSARQPVRAKRSGRRRARPRRRAAREPRRRASRARVASEPLDRDLAGHDRRCRSRRSSSVASGASRLDRVADALDDLDARDRLRTGKGRAPERTTRTPRPLIPGALRRSAPPRPRARSRSATLAADPLGVLRGALRRLFPQHARAVGGEDSRRSRRRAPARVRASPATGARQPASSSREQAALRQRPRGAKPGRPGSRRASRDGVVVRARHDRERALPDGRQHHDVGRRPP